MTLSNKYLIVCEYLVIYAGLIQIHVFFQLDAKRFAFVLCSFVNAWCPKWVACFDFCLLLHQSKMHTLITERSGPALFACALEGSRSIRAGSMDTRSA